MNRRIKWRFKEEGVSIISLSTLSVAMSISGQIGKKIGNQNLFGKKRKELKNKEAPAMLNIFPKFGAGCHEDIFKVLANVLRPISTPSLSTARSFLKRTISAAFFCCIYSIISEMPTSDACNALTSLIPSPRSRRQDFFFLRARTIRSFDWVRFHENHAFFNVVKKSTIAHFM